MGLFRRNQDPIEERERALRARIAALQGQIQDINQKIETERAQPKLRSTALPHSQASAGTADRRAEPGFEEVKHSPAEPREKAQDAPGQLGVLGLRRYDPRALARRVWDYVRGSPTPNPKLVNYLAAGSVHGLRPLRFEKRVAKKRLIAKVILIAVFVWGAIWSYLRNH
jgi:hypothetical protein